MIKQSKSKTSLLTIAVVIFAFFGFVSIANSSTSPFAQNDVDNSSQVTKGGDKKCGEGKCGDDKKDGDKKCGEGKCGDDKKGADKKDGKKTEKKCGEGKCG
ncbi:MAG: hypothetical protein JKX98_02700 [Alcanivoracaceae bacterium]|nr:hypothetical protein [Alcanivoracaceae bacterium]